jgi:hypothetical protein
MTKQVSFTYNFKTLTAVLFATLLTERTQTEEEKSTLAANFEAIEDGQVLDGSGNLVKKYKYKRRSVTVTLDLPDALDTVTSDKPNHVGFIENAITRVVADFVKTQYIDNFEAVGPHDLDTILAVQAASGSRSSVTFSFNETTLGNAVVSFIAYLKAVLGNEAAAVAVGAAAKQRFARSSITRSIGLYNEEVLKKLQGRVDSWGLWLEENDAENAEEFASVHACWSATLAKQLKADATVDIASIL